MTASAMKGDREPHKIKGSAANVGAEAMRRLAFEMEKAGIAGDLNALRILLPDLRTCFARLKEAMEQGAGPLHNQMLSKANESPFL